MFEVGLTELAMIALVALLVLGPERLPRAARLAGLYLRKARASWHSIRTDIERELAAEDMGQAASKLEHELGTDELRTAVQDATRELKSITRLSSAAATKSPDSDPASTVDTTPDTRE